MKAGKFVTMLAAASMAVTPVAAQAASSLSVARAMAPVTSASYLQDDDDGNGSTAVILGVVLIVLIGAAVISGSRSP